MNTSKLPTLAPTLAIISCLLFKPPQGKTDNMPPNPLSAIQDALNNPQLEQDPHRLAQTVLSQTQVPLDSKQLSALVRALLNEQSVPHQTFLLEILQNSGVTSENLALLKKLAESPPLPKTPEMEHLEKKIEEAKKKLSQENYATKLLGKDLQFEDVQFLILLRQKPSESLAQLEQYAGCQIQSLGSLPNPLGSKTGTPMQWTPTPTQTTLQQKIRAAARQALQSSP